MVNKDLDEDKIIVIEMNKRQYHLITGLLMEKGYNFQVKILRERTINSETFHNSSFIQDCFKKIFPEYDELPKGHRLLELQKLLEGNHK